MRVEAVSAHPVRWKNARRIDFSYSIFKALALGRVHCTRRLDQHAYRGLGPRCRELRGSCGGRAAEKGQVDQDARAQRPLSSSIGSFSPLIIRSSFLTSPPAAHKGALNGCAFGGGENHALAHREERLNRRFRAILG